MKINLDKAKVDLSRIRDQMDSIRSQLRGLNAQATALENFITIAGFYEEQAPPIEFPRPTRILH